MAAASVVCLLLLLVFPIWLTSSQARSTRVSGSSSPHRADDLTQLKNFVDTQSESAKLLSSKKSSPQLQKLQTAVKMGEQELSGDVLDRFSDLFRKRRRNSVGDFSRAKNECNCGHLVRFEANNCCRERGRCC